MSSGLEVRGLSVAINQKQILQKVTLAAPAGRLTALVGPNGAGKSTLLHALLGVGPPASGTVTFDGRDLHRLRRRDRARLAALVEQNVEAPNEVDVRRVVALGRTPFQSVLGGADRKDSGIIETAIARVGLTALAERGFQTLSGGERQRALLAKALAQQPRLLLLDEPTNHLDVHAQLETLGLLRGLAASGVTVLVALHDLNLAAANADQVIVLNSGEVDSSGPPAEVLTPETIRRVFRVEASVVDHGYGPLIAYHAPTPGI